MSLAWRRPEPKYEEFPCCACCQLSGSAEPCPQCGERAAAYTPEDQRTYDDQRLADEGKLRR